MCRNNKVANLLVAEAELSDMKYKHAAAIVQGGKIVSLGHNQTRTFFQARPHHSMHAEMSAISRAHASYSSNKRTSFGRGMSKKSGAPLNLHIPGPSRLTMSLANHNNNNATTAGVQPSMKGPPPDPFRAQPYLLSRTRVSADLGQQDRHALAGGPQYWVSPGTAPNRRAASRRSRSQCAAAAAAEAAATTTGASSDAATPSRKVELVQQEARGSASNSGSGASDDGALERDALAYKSMQFKLNPRKKGKKAGGKGRDLGSGSKAMWGADLYVCRVKKDGALASSKVCFRCLEWCIEAGIRRVFYTDEEEDGSIQWYQQSTLSLYEEVELSLEHAERATSSATTSPLKSVGHSSTSKTARSGRDNGGRGKGKPKG